SPTATGTLTSSDVDADATATWSVDTTPTGTNTTQYGTISIDPATGQWTYTLDNSLAATQALKEGERVEQTFTATVTDDNGATATETITVTINGTNDAPVVDSAAAAAQGSVTEDAAAHTATGTLTSSDVDANATEAWSINGDGSGTYGSIAIDPATGTWTYTLDNSLAATQGLTNGQEVTETFTATVTDDKGATDTQVITVTVTGTNDVPVITAGGTTTGSVTELADGHANENTINHTATGTLDFTDADITDAHQVSANNPAGYVGTFTPTVDTATGEVTWTFTVSDADIDHLDGNTSLTQTYTITLDDQQGGTTTQDVTITINGTNDAPVIDLDSDVGEGATGFSATYTEDDAPISIADTDMDVVDVDTPHLASATITLTNPQANDVLSTSNV
ncbi:MAG: hypothetical protein CSA53_08095, partial [Gammaproteobacteria bacterium]